MNQQFNDEVFGKSSNLTVGKYTAKTFGWMCIGLLITFCSALIIALSPQMAIVLLTTPGISIGLGIAQIAVVLFLSVRINKMSVGTATSLFLGYSFLTGITFSGLFYAYGFGKVIGVFLLTAIYFGALAAFGYFTDVDLSSMGRILSFGVIFLIISGLILLFVDIPFLDTVMCLAGIAIFLGLTAYDTQKIRQQYSMYSSNPELLAKASIFSALSLYLDFINLFIYLLRFMGNRND